jgi:hypothetical protein
MNRDQYLSQPEVNGFMDWLVRLTDTPNSFIHSYYIRKKKINWSSNSIYDAHEKYNWKFKCPMPNGGLRQGSSYIENQEVLDNFSLHLRRSLEEGDNDRLKEVMKGILKWGGVLGNKNKGNYSRIEKMKCPVDYLHAARNLVNMERFDLRQIDDIIANGIYINAGFTKIYSVLIDNFIIYDSRVGAALGLLVRKYLEAERLQNLPPSLDFSWAPGREQSPMQIGLDRRNPSINHFQFRKFSSNIRIHWLDNIRGSWLVSTVANRTRFADDCGNSNTASRRMEAALFMIGYDVRGNALSN